MTVLDLPSSAYDVIVVGAGLSGLTAARILGEAGYKVLVMEKRSQLGGNVYDYVDGNGIRIQKYGPHIFHTNEKSVFDFLSRFTKWEFYEHRVLGNINGKLVPIPFNLTSLYELFPRIEAEKIQDILIKEFGYGKKAPIFKLVEHGDSVIRRFAQFVYQNVFYFYTVKQWGAPPETLDREVFCRVPVYISHDDRYFADEYQFMPTDGFGNLAKNMADHSNLTVMLSVDALKFVKVVGDGVHFCGKPYGGKVIFTGQTEQLFEREFGRLPYRSLDFEFEFHSVSSYQPAAVVNYTTDQSYTRITEFTKFCSKPKESTVIVKEYSKEHKEGDAPYYPIPRKENLELYGKYFERAKRVKNLYLLGRLAQYKYVNMDVAVKNAMELAQSIIRSV